MSHSDEARSMMLGLFPAAGRATRLGSLSCSKEILPVPDREALDGTDIPVGANLLRYYRRAGIREIVLLRRAEKQDLLDTFRQEAYRDFQFIDHVTAPTPSTTHTIDSAFERLRGRPVALGYPDIIIDPPDMIARLVERLFAGSADICLSLVPAQNPAKWDMVDVEHGRVQGIAVKPGHTTATWSWVCAAWRPAFTEFLHRYLPGAGHDREVYVGHVIDAAIRAGFTASGVYFPDAAVLDIGTPEDLARARQAVPRLMAADPRGEFYSDEGCHITELCNSPALPGVSLARARVVVGATTRRHILKDITEVYVVQQGEGRVDIGGVSRRLTTGDQIVIPPGVSQCISNTGDQDLLFYCLCTPRFVHDAYVDIDEESDRELPAEDPPQGC